MSIADEIESLKKERELDPDIEKWMTFFDEIITATPEMAAVFDEQIDELEERIHPDVDKFRTPGGMMCFNIFAIAILQANQPKRYGRLSKRWPEIGVSTYRPQKTRPETDFKKGVAADRSGGHPQTSKPTK